MSTLDLSITFSFLLRFRPGISASVIPTQSFKADILFLPAAGIVTGPVMPPKKVHFPLREVSNGQERGWSAESFDSQPIQAESEVINNAPVRQPRTAPTNIEDQSTSGFARFLKEHSSPTHQRVTAGGRIVPVDPKSAPPEFKLMATDKKGKVKKEQDGTKPDSVSGLIVADLESGLASGFTGNSKHAHAAAAGPANIPAGNMYVNIQATGGNNPVWRVVANDGQTKNNHVSTNSAGLTSIPGPNIHKGKVFNPNSQMSLAVAKPNQPAVNVYDLPHNPHAAFQRQNTFPLSGGHGIVSAAAELPVTFAASNEGVPTKNQDQASQSLLAQRLHAFGHHVDPGMQHSLPKKPVKSFSAPYPSTNLPLPQPPFFNGVPVYDHGAAQRGFPWGVGRVPMMAPGQAEIAYPGIGYAGENASYLEALEMTVNEDTVKKAEKAFEDLGHKLRGQDGYTAAYVFDAELTAHYGRERAKIVQERDVARRTLLCVRDAWERKKQKQKEREAMLKKSVWTHGANGMTCGSKGEKPVSTNLNVRAAAWVPNNEKIPVQAADNANSIPTNTAAQNNGQVAAVVPDFPMNPDYDFFVGDPAQDQITHVCTGVRVIRQNGEQEVQMAAPYAPGPYTRRYMINEPLEQSAVDEWGIRVDHASAGVARMQHAQAQFLEELMLQRHAGGSLDQAITNIRQKMQQPGVAGAAGAAGVAGAMPVSVQTQLRESGATNNVPSIKLNGNPMNIGGNAPAAANRIKNSRASNVRKGKTVSEPTGVMMKVDVASKEVQAGVDKEIEKDKAKGFKEFKAEMLDRVEKAKMKAGTPINFTAGQTQVNKKTASSVSLQNINADGMVPGSQMVPSVDGAADRLNFFGTLSTVAKACRASAGEASKTSNAGTQTGSFTGN